MSSHGGTSLPYTSAPIEVPAYAPTPVTGGPEARCLARVQRYQRALSIFVPSQCIDDKLPKHFKINNQYIKAQVTPSDIQAHSVLLGAFHRLREEVRTFKGKADIQMEPDERWAVFLQRAVHRFEQWAARMVGGKGREEALGEGPKGRRCCLRMQCPCGCDGGVAHVHAQSTELLRTLLRRLPGVTRVGSFPPMQLAGSINQETLLHHPPSEGRVAAFTSFTSQPFDYPLNTTSDETVSVYWPNYSQPNTIPWITYRGDGFA